MDLPDLEHRLSCPYARDGHDYWQPGNLSAYNRITDSIQVEGLDLVGEYHSISTMGLNSRPLTRDSSKTT